MWCALFEEEARRQRRSLEDEAVEGRKERRT